MFLAHSIRLREPWQCRSAEGGANCYARSFHRPTGLESDDLVWLVIVDLPPAATVLVNGVAPQAQASASVSSVYGLQPATSPAFDLTPHLAETNNIQITLPSACSLQPTTSFPFDARLAIIGQS